MAYGMIKFSKDERRKIKFKNFKKWTPLMDRAHN